MLVSPVTNCMKRSKPKPKPGPEPEPFEEARLKGVHVIVDALLGTGFQGAPRKPADKVIAAINAAKARVIAADGSADLAGLRPAATYERQDATAVIRALASDAGASVERIQVTLQLAAYVAGQGLEVHPNAPALMAALLRAIEGR